MLVVVFIKILWMLSIMNPLGKEDYLLLGSKEPHSENKYQISSMKLCYGCIKGPYSVLYPHNARIVSCPLDHFEHLWCLVDLDLLLFQNQSVLSYCFHPTRYSQASDLYELFGIYYGELKLLWSHDKHNIGTWILQ